MGREMKRSVDTILMENECVKYILTFATVRPMGQGRCGDLVASTPIFPPLSLGTLTYPKHDTINQSFQKNNNNNKFYQESEQTKDTFAFIFDLAGCSHNLSRLVFK